MRPGPIESRRREQLRFRLTGRWSPAVVAERLDRLERLGWPVHQPGPALEAPIPGIQWYGGCEPGYPRVDPETGRCESCGELACPVCGRENCPDHERRPEWQHPRRS